MALPVIPFAVGAAAGAAATYLYKDKEVREDMLHTSLHYLSYLNPWKKKAEEAAKSESAVAESVEASVTEDAESDTEKTAH